MLTINTKASYTGNCGMSGKDWTGGRNGKAERAGNVGAIVGRVRVRAARAKM